MIFNNVDNVSESKYPLGLEGALMHVYENERNYCEMMKAVALSELRYYQDTGQDLFLNESGSFSNFLSRVKSFFKKVLEKIKSMFKKLYATIYSYIGDDKKFVRKYEKQLIRVNLQDFEFEGYEFPDKNFTIKWDKAVGATKMISKIQADFFKIVGTHANAGTTISAAAYNTLLDFDSKSLEDYKKEFRGSLINEGSMDESEFRDKLKDRLYGNDGEKTTLDNISIREQIQIITNAEHNIKSAKKIERDTNKWIDDVVKELERMDKEFNGSGKNNPYPKTSPDIINKAIELLRSIANDVTIISGLIIQSIKDNNRQAKAICVKALTYKLNNKIRRI